MEGGSADYIFVGAKTLLTLWFVLGFWAVAGIAVILTTRRAHSWHFPRTLEMPALSVLTAVPTLVLVFALLRMDRFDTSIVGRGCPVTGSNYTLAAWGMLLLAVAFVAVTSPLFSDGLLHIVFLSWGFIICLGCFMSIGWEMGAADLYSEYFPAARITVRTLNDAKVLVIGADSNNLVILPDQSKDRSERLAQPLYISRSEIKAFRLVGTAKVNDFFCQDLRTK